MKLHYFLAVCIVALASPSLFGASIPEPTRFIAPAEYAPTVTYWASVYGIPQDIAVRLAYEESRWNQNARNANRNGTEDRNLYQLNNRYFTDKPTSEHIKEAMKHLAWCYQKGGNWYKALLIWNAGHSRRNNPPEASIRFARRILDGGID